MGKNVKRGALIDVDPNDVIELIKTAGKIISDLLKKDKTDKKDKK